MLVTLLGPIAKHVGKNILRQERGAAGHMASTAGGAAHGMAVPLLLIQLLKTFRGIARGLSLGDCRRCCQVNSSSHSHLILPFRIPPRPSFIAGYNSRSHELEEVPAPGVLLLLGLL